MMFLFWDRISDAPEILGEDGNFYFYGEDSVAIANGDEGLGRYWVKVNPYRDVTPINTQLRFDIYDPKLGEWVRYDCARKSLCQRVQKLSGVKDWKDVY